MSATSKHSPLKSRIRDFVLYCAIGIAVALAAVGYGAYEAKTGSQARGFPVEWLGLFIMTGFLLYFAIRAFRGFPDRRRFWSLIVIFGAGHFLAASLLLPRIHRMTLGDFAIATVPEYFILMAYLRHFLAPKA
jgi:ABC-type Co2+ transport system permease subunit